MVDLVYLKNSKCSKEKGFNFFLPSQSLDQCKIGGGGKIIPLRSTLSFN